MKNIIYFFSTCFFLLISILACNKSESAPVTPNDSNAWGTIRATPSIEDALHFANEDKSGFISLLATKGFNQTKSVAQVSGGLKNATTSFGSIQVNNLVVPKNSSNMYSTGANEMQSLRTEFGNNISFKAFDNATSEVFAINHRAPLELNANLPFPSGSNSLSRTSAITWNADSRNNKGVYLILVSLTEENTPISARAKQLNDNGSYTLSEADCAHIPSGGKCKVYLIRGNADKQVFNNENYYFASGTIVSSIYKI